MATVPILIDGPISPNGVEEGPPTPLVLLQESTVETDTDTNPQDIPTQDSDETILTPIAGKKSIRADGVIQGSFIRQNVDLLPNRINPVKEADGSLSAANAFRLYSYLIESLVQPEQGRGYRLRDEVRDTTLEPTSRRFGVLFDSYRMEYNSGDGFKGKYNISGKVTDGVQDATDRTKYFDRQKDALVRFLRQDRFDRTTIVLPGGGSIGLGEVEKLTRERKVNLQLSDLLHAEDEKEAVNVAAINSGVKQSVTVKGRIADQQTTRPLERVADIIEIGIHGEEVLLHDTITGRTQRGAISDSSATLVSGTPNRVRYRVSFDEGNFPAGRDNTSN